MKMEQIEDDVTHVFLLTVGNELPMRVVETINTHGEPVWAIQTNGLTIFNPRVSECGRFAVDPVKTYDITEDQADVLHDLNLEYGYDDSL
jgi:hypothetical protein